MEGFRWIMKRFIKYLCVILFLIIIFISLNELVRPKYKTDLIEGSLISDYYNSSFDHDVILLGDCEVYANISPLEMYHTAYIKAFNRATPQQMIYQSYDILKETLTYEKPKLIILSVGALRNGSDKKNEAYNRLTIDNMRFSKNKLAIIKDSKTDEESYLSYIFPILRYHSRITSLTLEDILYFNSKKSISYNGFIINKDVKPLDNLPTKRPLSNYDFSKENMSYLDKIVKLCAKEEIPLLLIKTPSIYPYWYDEYDTFMESYAKDNNINYLNMIKDIDMMQIDFNSDTYDGGLHLNLSGATKASRYLAEYLKNNYSFDLSKSKEYETLYDNYAKNI